MTSRNLTTMNRTLTRLAAGGATATMLVAGVATTADAATKSYPHLSTASVKAAMPAADKLPGGVKLVLKGVSKKTAAVICLSAPKIIALPGANGVTAVYSNPVKDESSPKYLTWHIAAAVYTTPAKAAAAGARLLASEKACPVKKTTTGSGYTETVSRTLSTKYAVGSWTGYRSIDHITGTGALNKLQLRDNLSYLVRGNVLVSIEEVGTNVGKTSGATQEVRRKAVTALIVARLSAIK